MKKYICGATALLLAATLLFGCGKSNVSDHPGGKITDPTSVMPTIIPEPTITTDETHSASTTPKPTTGTTEDTTRTTEMTFPFVDGSTDAGDSSNHTEKNRTDIHS